MSVGKGWARRAGFTRRSIALLGPLTALAIVPAVAVAGPLSDVSLVKDWT